MFQCRIKSKTLPIEGEIVTVRISDIKDDIVFAKLLEYGEIEGLIMSSELSKKKYRSIHQVAKIGNIELCQVIMVEKSKCYIDLSLKRIGEKEKAIGKDEFAKSKLAYQIMLKVSKTLNIDVKNLYENWGYAKEEEYGTLFQFLAKAKENPSLLEENEIDQAVKKAIEDHFKGMAFKVRIDVDVSVTKGGINLIKEAFQKALDYDKTLEIALIKPPTYSIQKISDNKEESFLSVNTAANLVKEFIVENGGIFDISSPAKLFGDKSKYEMFEDVTEDQKSESSDQFDDSD